jgi:UDP-N-acetylglucosamine 4,6-dehydratase/5-epimerase
MRTLLITGGTGFLGQRLAKELRPLFSKIILSSRYIQKNSISDNLENEYVLAPMDIADRNQVDLLFQKYKPDFVLHTAAVKSVKAAEMNPVECINTNIVGSENIARAAAQYNCEKVVAISSLRAAPPAEGVYGMSKALMEKIFCTYAANSNTQYISIRLGNIAWAPDSVLNLWKQMVENDGLIRSTGFGMSRYFITSDEMIRFVKSILFLKEQYPCLIVVPVVKLIPIARLLKLFTEKFGGEYELSKSAIHEKKSDFLIGKSEVPYARKMNIDGNFFYGIAGEKQVNELSDEAITSDSNQIIRDDEIRNIIKSY